jgi:hypothetical protein
MKPLNASVDAKVAKEDRKERKGREGNVFFSSLRPWYFLFAFFASTLAFNTATRGTP